MDDLWDTTDLARFLGKSPQWVRENLSPLGIPAIKVGQQWRFFPSEVITWINESR